jgi:hypothetical protein
MFVAAQFDDAARERISDAAQFEKRLRLEAFLGVSTQIGVFSLRQFTCKDYCVLDYTENKLLSDCDSADDLDYVSFLWNMRPSSENRSEARFAKWAGKHIDSYIKREIQCFLLTQFNDMPSGSSEDDKTSGIGDSTAPIASIVDIISHNYGWTCDYTMSQPLQVVLQLMQRIFKRNLGDKYSISNRITQQARANELNKS